MNVQSKAMNYIALYRRIKRYQRQHDSLADMAFSGLISSRRRLSQAEQNALTNRAEILMRQIDLMQKQARA